MNAQYSSQVILKDPFVTWYDCSDEGNNFTVYTRGFTYFENRLYEKKDLATFIAQKCTSNVRESYDNLDRVIPDLDVGWALAVVWRDGSVFAATDRVRSIPLLYASIDNCLFLAARIENITEQTNLKEIDPSSALEFLTFGYVTLDRTLIKQIFQMQPGEILKCDRQSNSQLSLSRYFLYRPQKISSQSFTDLQDELEAIFEFCFRRIVDGLNGEPILVPLSGGLDSRLVAGMLKKVGYENVICFSYGRYGNPESKISQEVSQSLGYRWEYIEYTSQIWQQWIERDAMKSFWSYCSNGISIPSIKQLPAATAVLEKLQLKRSDRYLFFPGYCLDFPAGSLLTYFLKNLDNKRFVERNTVEKIINQNCYFPDFNPTNIPEELHQELLGRVISTISVEGKWQEIDAMEAYEKWIFENRVSRFAVNTLRIHDYLGAEWRMLWDNPITDFFLKVPAKYRYGKKLYATVLQERIFTGSAEKLATIPLAKIGKWRGRDGIGLATRKKRFARALMKQLGILNKYYKSKKSLAKNSKSDLNDTYWFTNGIDPSKVKVQTILEEKNILQNIPCELHPFLQEFYDLNCNEVSPFFLLAAVSLAELKK